jgi:phosphotriesterase-related protein
MSAGLVRTVLGDVSPDLLGHTQCHEHIFIFAGPSCEVNPALRMDDFGKSLDELVLYREAGGGAVLDAQPAFCGRMASALTAASKRTGVHVVAVTGFHKSQFYEPDSFPMTAREEALARFFVSEVEVGMIGEDGSRSASRTGVVKAALDAGGLDSSLRYRRSFEAAAEAAIQTGAPILVHTEKGADVRESISFFMGKGIEPERLILCHLDRTQYDASLHKELLSAGCYLCYDSINRLKYLSHELEISLILEILAAGHEERILLSLDTTSERSWAYGGYMGLDYILTTFVPMLRAEGVDEGVIAKMTRDNAHRVLALRHAKTDETELSV